MTSLAFLQNSSLSFSRRETVVRNVVGIILLVLPFSIFAVGPRMTPDSGASVPWRPPSQTYIVAWTLLVCMLSASWLRVSKTVSKAGWRMLAPCYLLLSVLCITWVLLYSIDKSFGIPVFIFLIMTLSFTLPVAMHTDILAGSLLMPLATWAIVQMIVNCVEVQNLTMRKQNSS